MPEWNIDVNREFDDFKRLFNEGKSIFLTGKAGTGKSTFIKQIISETEKNVVVVAPTGIAAVNIGGVTIHSFFKLPFQPLIPDDEHIPIITGDNRKIISEMDVLIIDEISMVRADVLDAIDCSLRKNGGDTEKPFGGKQVILVGDIFQLEPVTPSQNGEDLILKEFYPLPCYFFDAIAYKKLNPEIVELQKVYRQTDKEYLEILNRIRKGEQTQNDLDIINQNYSPNHKTEEFTIELATTNYVADNRNFNELAKLNTKQFNYEAKVEGKFDERRFPAPYDLYLKENAQVMFVKNGKHWVNGTIAKVINLTNEVITIQLENGNEYEVEKATWENKEFRFNRQTRKVETTTVGTFTQYPLKLAWSITIHKSQGLTFEKVFLNFGNGAFAAGQAYVALSRCTSLQGLRLQTKIFNSDIIIDERVKNYASHFIDTFIDFDYILKNSIFFNTLFATHYKFSNQELIKFTDVLCWGGCVYSFYDSNCMHLYSPPLGLSFNSNISWNKSILDLANFDCNHLAGTWYDEKNIPLDKRTEIERNNSAIFEGVSASIRENGYVNDPDFWDNNDPFEGCEISENLLEVTVDEISIRDLKNYINQFYERKRDTRVIILNYNFFNSIYTILLSNIKDFDVINFYNKLKATYSK